MRRISLAVLLALLMLVPVTGASASTCDTGLAGSAKLDYGKTGEGKSKLFYDGEKIKVDFVATAFVPTGDNTADVFMDWFFPEGTVSIVEHSTVTPIAGPLVSFTSTIEVLSGGSGHWTWSGISNLAAGRAWFDLEGTLCFDG